MFISKKNGGVSLNNVAARSSAPFSRIYGFLYFTYHESSMGSFYSDIGYYLYCYSIASDYNISRAILTLTNNTDILAKNTRLIFTFSNKVNIEIY